MAVLKVPGEYPSIAAAVAAATAGDTIAVAAGYSGNESVVVTVDDLLFSAPPTVAGIDLTAGDGVTTIRLSGSSTIDVMGSGAANVIVGNTGNNLLIGGGGDDQLAGGAGSDRLEGGAGTDTVSYASAPSGVNVNLLHGRASDGQARTDTLSGIENVRGSGSVDAITGDGERNVLQGAEGNDTLNGGGGGDELYGDAGSDKLYGNDGDDLLVGGAGNDQLDGGEGIDAVVYQDSNSGVTVNLLTGTATDGMFGIDTLLSVEAVFGSHARDTLILGSASGYAYGRAGNDTITGGAGDDEIYGGAGADRIDGGDGIDTVNYLDDGNNGFVQSAGVKVDLLGGTAKDNGGKFDVLIGIENVTGSGLADTLVGNHERNVLNGDHGNDSLRGNGGNDVLYGGGGVDLLQGGEADDNLIGGAGDDRLDGGNGRDMAVYESAAGAVTVNLLAGTATDGLGGTDTLARIESAMGGRFKDTLILGNVAGFAYGRAGNDMVTGGAADDELSGGSGADVIDGGAGIDTANYLDDGFDSAGTSIRGVAVNLLNGRARDNWGKTDTLKAIENVTGSRFADTLAGDAARNVLAGGLGNDRLNGNSGDDVLSGGTGDDALNGNDGMDAAVYEDATSGVVVNLAAGTASDGLGGTDTLGNIEGVVGSRSADTLTLGAIDGFAVGRGGDDRIMGGGANDVLNGGSGADTLHGGAGTDTVSYFDDGFDGAGVASSGVSVNLAAGKATDNWGHADTLVRIENVSGSALGDTLSGNSQVNSLDGLAGNDRLDGGAGADFLNGGTGADTFAFTTALATSNIDTVADFVSGGDRFELAKAVFSALDLGPLSATAFAQAMAASTADQHILYNATTGVVSYDADGNGAGAAMAFAALVPGQMLTAADFKVV